MTLDCRDLAWRGLKAHRLCGFLLSCQGRRGGIKAPCYSSGAFRQSVFNHKRGGRERSQANKDRVKISPALTDLSSLLHDGKAFIYYFKEVEKIITTVIPHLMCPKPPITPWPTALSLWIQRGEGLSVCSSAKIRFFLYNPSPNKKKKKKDRCFCCLWGSLSPDLPLVQNNNIKNDNRSYPAAAWNLAKHLRTASLSSIITYSPVRMIIRLTRAGLSSS